MWILDWSKGKNQKLDQAKKTFLQKYSSGDMDRFDAAIRMLHNQKHQNGIDVLKYVAQNSRYPSPYFEVNKRRSDKLINIWEEIDSSSYDKYISQLKILKIKQLSAIKFSN